MERNISSTQKEEVRPLQTFFLNMELTDEIMMGYNLTGESSNDQNWLYQDLSYHRVREVEREI